MVGVSSECFTPRGPVQLIHSKASQTLVVWTHGNKIVTTESNITPGAGGALEQRSLTLAARRTLRKEGPKP